jgi:NAD(P)-dependent dehydrogenase (short-subunit alcohol dehydrogenase family)
MGRFADLSGKVAIVTGGAVGIGGAIGNAFADNGVAVVVVDKDPAAAEKKAAELSAGGAGAAAIVCDVTEPDPVRRMVEEVMHRFGRIDILVNGTGNRFGGQTTLTLSPEEWDATFALCLRAHYLCSRAVLPHMIARGWGRIINISSDAGRQPVRLTSPAYAAAKAGVIGFTKHLALEVARQGITVNATVPGTTFTPRTERSFALNPAGLTEREARNPMGRLAVPEEQAGIVVFLASDEARYITGAVIEVTGGLLMT